MSFFNVLLAQNNADDLLNFIKQNKNRASLYITENDSVIAAVNENKMMPLASTFKIIVAIEFAKQVAKQTVKATDMIALTELNRYYLPNTDGDAHPNWLAYEKSKKHLINDSVQLLDVARGMIMFSSNANTEYLMEVLGLDNINKNIATLGLKKHDVIFPIVGSLFMYQNPKKSSEKSILKGIKSLSEEQYCRFIYDMHKALTYDTILKNKYRNEDFSLKLQKLWSDKLPNSTTKDYVRLCSILNNRTYFDDETYDILSSVLETIMENPANKQWLKHAGMKGGSTAWVLTKAIYGTTKKGKRIEMAYFFNDLTPQENTKLQGLMNTFELNVLSNDEYRKKVTNAFK
jgi:D-alanyl-D-alanine carboxypeptidase